MAITDPSAFTNSNPHTGAYLVYLNGIQVPCQSVNVSYGVWQIPEATLNFPPHRLLQRLGAEDRIEVVIFFLDDLANPERPEFKLLFEGELLGWSYRNSPGGRTMSFNAIADISMYKQLHFFFMNSVDSIVGAGTEQDILVNGVIQPGVCYPFSIFKKGLLSVDKKPAADIEQPFDILNNILRGMVGVDIPDNRKSIPGINFFARWARKRNFINRFVALPYFEDDPDPTKGAFPIFKAAAADQALATLQQNIATTVGDAGSLYDVLQSILGIVYFEMVMLPTAPCYRTRLSDGVILGTSDLAPSTPDKINLEPLRLANYFLKSQMLFAIPPNCNVFFPSMINSYTYQENYVTQPTRIYINEQFLSTKTPQSPLGAAAQKFAYPPEARAVLNRRGGADINTADENPVVNGKNLLIYPEEFFKGPVLERMPVPAWFTYLKNNDPANKPDAGPGAQDQNEARQKLHELYCQYEYYRTRYEKRGGAIDSRWNPYVVPGFPCVIFDERSSAVDVTGYVMSVNQSLSSGSMSTSINFGFGRTLQEMFDLLKTDMAQLGVIMGAAPADPVDQIREITQDPDQAEKFYNAIFHGRNQIQKKAAFSFTDMLAFVKPDPTRYDDDQLEPITVQGPTMQSKKVTYLGGSPALAEAAAANDAPPTTNLDGTRDIEPTAAYEEIFENYDAAMAFVSRPICTLEEYIYFIHGGRTIPALIASGQVAGPQTEYVYDDGTPGVRSSATYYARIKKLRQGPGTRPSDSATGASSDPPSPGGTTPQSTAYTGDPTGVAADFPQTRADWDRILLAYRDEIYNRLAPQR